MRKLLILFIAGGIFGTAIGFGVGIFVYPNWFPNDVAGEAVAHVKILDLP